MISAVVATTVFFTPVALADSLDAQIAALNAQVSQEQAAASALQGQADTLSNKVAQLNDQVSAVTAQLRLNQTKRLQTAARINDAQQQLTAKKSILDENVRNIYQQSQITPLEMLASSKNFSDFVDKQQYLDQIKSHIQDEYNQVSQLENSLQQQQLGLNILVSQQAGLQAALLQQENEQQQLLASTQGQESAYQQQASTDNAKKAQLEAQQAAAIQAVSRSASPPPGASGGSGGACDNGHGNGGYPMSWCSAGQDSIIDSWGMYNRECVSWAAWRRSQNGRPVRGWGNANQWADGARSDGYRVDSSPEVGAVAQTSAGPFGHVAIVEAVAGGQVEVSEMNYDDAGHFRYSYYPASYFVYIH